MALKAHTWPGLDNPVYLPEEITVEVKIIPSSVPGWTSGTKSTQQTTLTQHFTGNMSSSANGEYNWAAGGGRAAIGSAGSYNLIVDGTRVIVAQRFDEMVGHAANNTGNYTSYACEMAIGAAGGYDGAFKNAAHVAAAVIVAKGWQVDTALVKHQYWRRANGEYKYCPSIILDKGDWPRFVQLASENAANIRAHLAAGDGTGGAPAPKPVYATPAVIPELDAISKSAGFAPASVVAAGTRWYWVGDRVRVTAATTPRLQRAANDAARVGPDLKKGEEFDVDWIAEYQGALWYYSPWGTRIAAADTERTSDTKADAA